MSERDASATGAGGGGSSAKGGTVCPRCGFRDSFRPGALPETCECGVCLSQLDWREIPGCGPDCLPLAPQEEES